MGLFDDYKKKQNQKTKLKTGLFSDYKKEESSGLDLSTSEGLLKLAEQSGLSESTEKIEKPKQSLWEKFSSLISRGTYTSAGIAKALIKGENVAQEAWKGFTGKEKETYSDVLSEAGVTNKYAKAIGGFAGDVLLDPTTYAGGFLAKLGIKTIKGATKIGGGVVDLAEKIPVAGKTITGLKEIATGTKNVLAETFVPGYGASAGLYDKNIGIINKLYKAKSGIEKSYIERFVKGADIYPGSEQNEIVKKALIKTRLMELEARTIKKTGGKIAPELSQKGKFAELAFNNAREAGATDDTISALEKQFERNLKIAKTGNIKDPYEVYFPFIDKERLKKFEQSTRGIKKSSEGYRKEFKAMLKEKDIIGSVPEAYARREYQIVRDKIIDNGIDDIIKSVGKNFDSVEAAAKEGYVPIYKKGYPELKLYKIKYEPSKELINQISIQKEPFERAMIKVGKGIEDAINEGVPVAKKSMGSKAGAYYPRTNEIKLKYFTPEVLLHERGHSWDFMNDKLSKVVNTKKVFQQELKTLTEKFYGGTAQEKGSAVEKWAVFIDKFIHEPAFVKKNAPMFTSYFRRKISTDWTFKKEYQEAAKQIKIIDKTIQNIKPAIEMADKGYLKTAIETAFPSKEAIGFGGFKPPAGYLKQVDKKLVDDYFTPEFSLIDKFAQASGMDTFTNLWKMAVTKFFPAFHARNWASGVIQNYEVIGIDALNPLVHKQANQFIKELSGKTVDSTMVFGKITYKTKKLTKAFENKFGRGNWRRIADIGDAIGDATKELEIGKGLEQASSKLRNLGKKLDYGEKLGRWTEEQQKAVAFIGSLRQGKSIDESLNLAEKAGFDYQRITNFEKKILRRLIPFYTFSRKNLELQYNVLKTNPQRIGNIIKGFRGTSAVISGSTPTEEEMSGLPPWVKESLNIRTGMTDEYGRQMYSTFSGLAPEQAMDLLSGNIGLKLASQGNPLIKYMIEKSFNVDTFRSASGDRIVTTQENINADKYAKIPMLNKWLGIREVQKPVYVKGKRVGTKTGYEGDPEKIGLLETLPSTRFINSFSSLSDTSKGLVLKGLESIVGLKSYPVDVPQQQYFEKKAKKEKLKSLLEQYGITRNFDITYVPKK